MSTTAPLAGMLFVLTVNGEAFDVALEDNAAAQALVDRLPLAVSMKELNGNEKYADLAKPLPAEEQSVGRISAGDLMLWGDDCLVLFYESFRTPYRYTRLGRVVNPASLKAAVGAGSVRIELKRGR